MIGVPQALVIESGPTHGLPHELPAMQARLLTCIPAPHFTEQTLNGPKAVHLE